MNKNIFLYILVVISLLSCSKNKNHAFDYKQNVIYVKGEFLLIDQLIGNPYEIICIDTLLIYHDPYRGNILSVFDLKNNNFVGRFVSEGQGPNEVIPSRLFLLQYTQKDILYMFQSDIATLTTFDIPDFNISNKIQIGLPTQQRSMGLQRGKDYYIGIGKFEEGRFKVYNSEVEYLYTGATYPLKGKGNKGKDIDPGQAFYTYQGNLCMNPDKNYFAMSCLFSDHIAFYEVKEDEIITLKEYYSYDANIDFFSSSNNVGGTTRISMGARPKNESVISYTAAYGTASYCYMLFNGKTYGETGKVGSGHYIVVFDWQGNYIKTYNTDYEIRTFCVDENNNCIYATTKDKNLDPIIIKFKI